MIQKLETLKEELLVKEQARFLVEASRKQALQDLLIPYFTNVVEEKDEIKVSLDRMEFLRPQEGYTYNKTYFEVYFRTDWSTGEANQVNTSVYSSSGNDEWELKRLISVGKAAQSILDFQKEILAVYNSVMLEFKESYTRVRDEEWAVEREISIVKKLIKEGDLATLLKRAEIEEIHFTKSEGRWGGYPDFNIGYKDQINKVKKIQILSKSYSGKSAEVKVTIATQGWDDENKVYLDTEYTSNWPKIKMSYIEQFLTSNVTRSK